ncbi:MAG: type II secretion system F family protein [Lachnospiraceae bacterium]|nr:type II secretion system F family protein [Lachnospiraceae bacterium]
MKIFYRLAEIFLRYFTPKETEYVREKQMLMHPGESGAKLTRDYFIKKLGTVIAVITSGIILSAAVLIADIKNTRQIADGSIERNSYGGGEKSVTLDLYKDGELFQKGKRIVIDEKQYTEAEIRAIFKETADELEASILGDNRSADHIDHDLILPEKSPVYPVSIEWLIGDYDVLDSSGHIQDSYHDEAGREVRLTAGLSYGSYGEDHVFYVKVYPEYREADDRLSHDIDRSISEYAAYSASQNAQKLPDTVDGFHISYEKSLSHTWLYILLTAVLAGSAVYIGKDRDLKSEVAKREREMLLDYPEIVSKLTLLIGAGLTLRAAFEKVASDYKNRTCGRKSYACEEMLITVHRMKSGVSEYEAYLDFGKRCAVRRYIKLGALFSQNIKKGSSGLLTELEKEVREAFEERKVNARKRGEEAGTKLLLPMAMMLSVVMIVIIVPDFMAFSL